MNFKIQIDRVKDIYWKNRAHKLPLYFFEGSGTAVHRLSLRSLAVLLGRNARKRAAESREAWGELPNICRGRSEDVSTSYR